MVEFSGGSERNVSFDLDGSKFVKELVRLTELGNAYCANSQSGALDSTPPEPLQFAVATLIDLLSLVGFSSKTTHHGSSTVDGYRNVDGSNIQGGEVALVEEAIQMRSNIRTLALNGIKGSTGTHDADELQKLKQSLKDILDVCDRARDANLPSLGVEVFDGKSEETAMTWRWCTPRKENAAEKKEPSKNKNTNKNKKSNTRLLSEDTNVEDMFREGQYAGMFSEYDENGIPVTKADGSSVSKNQRKKFAKVQEKVMKKRGIKIKTSQNTNP